MWIVCFRYSKFWYDFLFGRYVIGIFFSLVSKWENFKNIFIYCFISINDCRKENYVKFVLFYKDLYEFVVLDIVMYRYVYFVFG